ncbi:Non-classical export protein 2 [Escovopsis weberi]|uniref:Non-classical export protein 2 n=1 Tax=Escovopsis weberi TaxID=150374 RepID=A0A0M9VUV0_ESCWE|nr:Non-classical export protein 2 [Escovopsis weberi]
MDNRAYVILLLVALLWTLLVTALIGNVIATNINGAMATINFTMFTAALAWVVGLVGLAAAFVSTLARPILLIPLYFLAVLFTFIDGIALAAVLRAPDCGNLAHASLPRHWIGFGSSNDAKRCRELEASTAFLWFLWATFSVVFVIAIFEARRGIGSSALSSRPMSQIG